MSLRHASDGVRACAVYRQGKSDGVASPLRALALRGCRPPALRSATQRCNDSKTASSRFYCSPLAPLRLRPHPVQNPRGAGVKRAALAVAP